MIDGEPVVKLPPRELSLVKQQFSKQEQSFYAQLQKESAAKFKVHRIYYILKNRQTVMTH